VKTLFYKDIKNKKNFIFFDRFIQRTFCCGKLYDYEISDNFNEREKCYNYLNQLYEIYIQEISDNLNQIHNDLNFTKKEWKILIGPWLNNFLSIAYNRYKKIELYFETNTNKINIVNFQNASFTPRDTLELSKFCNSKKWNTVFYSKIIKFLKNELVNNELNLDENINKINKFNFNIYIKNILKNFLFLFSRKNNFFILGTYLNLISELKLNIRLKQFMVFWPNSQIYKKHINEEVRKKIQFKKKKKKFENFLNYILSESIPTIYIENFNDLKKKIDSWKLSKCPKLIFTSNNYEFDELFKYFVSSRTLNGSKYIIGQHGNISSLENKFFEEKHGADNYIYWGRNGLEKENGFNFKFANEKIKKKTAEKLLVMSHSYGTNNKIYNRLDQNFQKKKNLITLLKNLSVDIQKTTELKLHSSYHSKPNHINNLKKKIPEIDIIDNEKIKIIKKFSQSKCIIHTYDSTGILESFLMNVPTLCTWENFTLNIRKEYHKLYEDLKNHSIFFDNPSDLSKFINLNWNNIEKWWLDKNVQKVKNRFLEKFSNPPSSNSISLLAKNLRDYNRLKSN